MLKATPLVAIVLSAFICIPFAGAAENSDQNWPCVQRKIPALSAGMMWVGPAIDDAARALWRNDTQLSALAVRLSARRTALEDAQKLIETYVASIDPDHKTKYLTALFAGVLEQINKERQQILAGIEKYTRKQKALADNIRKTRVQFAEALKVKAVSEEDKQARRNLEQKLSWQSRIHEEREKSLIFVCESPVILEQRAFAIAREIANQLE